MLDKTIKDFINDKINKEFYSAYLYLNFVNYYYEQGLDGFVNCYDVQTQEKRDNAMLMRTYLNNNGETIMFEVIAKPDKIYYGIDCPLKLSMEHEQYITDSINTIYRAASEIHDYSTMKFYDWFVKNKGEEEKNSEDVIRKHELFETDPKNLYALNMVKTMSGQTCMTAWQKKLMKKVFMSLQSSSVVLLLSKRHMRRDTESSFRMWSWKKSSRRAK